MQVSVATWWMDIRGPNSVSFLFCSPFYPPILIMTWISYMGGLEHELVSQAFPCYNSCMFEAMPLIRLSCDVAL